MTQYLLVEDGIFRSTSVVQRDIEHDKPGY